MLEGVLYVVLEGVLDVVLEDVLDVMLEGVLNVVLKLCEGAPQTREPNNFGLCRWGAEQRV